MSVTVDQAWVYQFHDVLNLTYQQMGSLLENILDTGMVHRNVKAAIDHHERLGNVIASDQINPFGQTQFLNPAHSRRATTLQSSDATVLISDENTLRSMVNPQNGYTRTIAAACGRRADKHIIDATTGAASVATVASGSGIITYGTQALPAGQILGTGIAITLLNIIDAGVLLSKNGVPTGPAERKWLYSPGQLRDIMQITQASSSDFTKNQIHDKGTLNGVSWEGFDWIEIADVVDPALAVLQRMLSLTSTTRRNVAFHKGAIGLSIGKPVGTPQIDPRPDLQSRPTQVRQNMMMSAVRVWEGGVVAVDVLEN